MIKILNSMHMTKTIELPKAYQNQIDSNRILKSPCFSSGLDQNKIEHINVNYQSMNKNDEDKININSGLKIQNYNINVKDSSEIS